MFPHQIKIFAAQIYSGIKNFPFKKKIVSKTEYALRKVKLQLNITYNTSGLVRYMDENNSPKIIEFHGKKWEIEIYTTSRYTNSFKVFVNNSFLRINESLTLTSIVDDIVQSKREFIIRGKDLFEGWFSLES